MEDSCTSVSLSFVGSIVYLPATRVERKIPISHPIFNLLYPVLQLPLSAWSGGNSECARRTSILCTRPSLYSLSGTGVTFCGKALSPLGLHALHFRAVLEVAEAAFQI